ncbi:MATE family efflux transporter [Candidatus Parcubacteria bacterium]|nr:MAG: MATE family efflux transporter [Candidatus Parcubacteria bacterium]
MEEGSLISQPIPKLIRDLAIPASVGFFFNTMYNVVDTYYGGLISTQAVAALSLSFPVFFIIISLSSGISTGTSALIAHALGEGNREEAKKYLTQAISFTIILSLILSVLGWVSGPYLFGLLGASGDYLKMALSYINIIFGGTVLFALSFVINSSLTSQGDTKTFRNFLVFGFLLNLLLDPWFMFGWLGFPALGLAGVAWATLLIQFFSVIYISYKAIKNGILCKSCLHMFKPEAKYFKEISKQGFPASLNMMTIAIGIFIITYFISPFGKSAVAAYGIATRIDQIFLLPTMGLNIASLALIGQNNGAKKYDRVRLAYKTNLKYGFWIMSIGMVLVLLFNKFLMQFFSKDPNVVDIGTHYLSISAFIYISYVISAISISALQGLKKPFYAIWIGIYRQIIGPIVFFGLLATFLGFGLSGVWWAIFIINWSAAIITYFYTKNCMKNNLGDSKL